MAPSRASTYPGRPMDNSSQRQIAYHMAQSSVPDPKPDASKPEPSSDLEEQKHESISALSQPFQISSFAKTWAWELLSLVASILCLVTMLILLLVYQAKSVPELSLGLTVGMNLDRTLLLIGSSSTQSSPSSLLLLRWLSSLRLLVLWARRNGSGSGRGRPPSRILISSMRQHAEDPGECSSSWFGSSGGRSTPRCHFV
jgi:hypothetical protein